MPDIKQPHDSSFPIYVMTKPAGPSCNLACSYCYYTEKKTLFPSPSRRQMDDAMLERFIRQYLDCNPHGPVQFLWHGGEPTLRPLEFYEKAIKLQEMYAGDRKIENCLQTNGTLLNSRWCRFFHDNGWLVGLSIDGPQKEHDVMRRDVAGNPTFRKVMKAAELLNRHNVEWNAMAAISSANVGSPIGFYRFFKSLGTPFLQFTPVVERRDAAGGLLPPEAAGGVLTPYSVTPRQWGDFLIAIFNEWVKNDVGKFFVQIFDATLSNWCGLSPGVCSLSGSCGHAAALEHNGDLYSCDHFVFPEYCLGNISTATIAEMMNDERQRAFAQRKQSLPQLCLSCRWESVCHGECPKNRFVSNSSGEPPLNYLCEGYRRFFAHAAPYMDFMKSCVETGEDPARVMTIDLSTPSSI